MGKRNTTKPVEEVEEVESTEEEVEDTEEEVEDTEEEISSKDSATVNWQGQSRVYSKEVHGKGYKALAQEFATKKGGIVA
jgi:uncharacterized protein YlxW (UPF0749 family)